MDRVSRRRFLATSLTAASAARVVGANDRIRLGVVRLGHVRSYRSKRRIARYGMVAVADAGISGASRSSRLSARALTFMPTTGFARTKRHRRGHRRYLEPHPCIIAADACGAAKTSTSRSQ